MAYMSTTRKKQQMYIVSQCYLSITADYTYKLRVDVSDSSSASSEDIWQPCFNNNIEGIHQNVPLNCDPRAVIGGRIKIQQFGFTFMHICEAEVYGTIIGW